MAIERESTPEPDTWLVGAIRLTAFVSDDPLALDGDQIWHELTGAAPESMQRTRAARRYEGEFEDAGLILTLDESRVEFLRAPKVKADELPAFETLGPLSKIVGTFSQLVCPWLEHAPPLNRLAFGTVLFQSAKDQNDGYRRLAHYLPALNLNEATSDLTFRINRRRKAKTMDVEINRLSTWSFIRREQISLSVSDSGKRHTPRLVDCACRVDLDMNTRPNPESETPTTLPSTQLAALWYELVDLGLEIAAEGDKP
jgi:hypothetical protein